ncbi:hypothetical protein R3P38DRAFT_3465937 [Favolaschia claudopus]|uniref:DUF6533 domain-containing protein n=1 Tax=Favolaschia claudopus TaxID=2862362 RepID=A0AAV9ZEL6_9AGAR
MDSASLAETLQIFYTLKYITGERYHLFLPTPLEIYISAAAIFILLIFDHCLTMGQEVKTIWGNSTVRLHSKAAFVINRYLTEGVTAFQRNLDDFGYTFVVLIRVYALWDRRANVARLLVSVFGICISTTTILGIFGAMAMQRSLTYSASLHTCVFGTKPKTIIAMLAVLSVFDFFLAVLVVFNAMDRPRLTHVELVSGLQTDGLGLFLILWCLRLADVIIAIFKPPAEVFVAITAVWAVCSIVNARLHMRLEGLALSRAKGTVVMLEDMM